MKLDQDNPYHTDVWLGCGFDIDDQAYVRSNPKYHAVVDMMFEIQKKMLNFEVQVLLPFFGIADLFTRGLARG